MAYVRSHKLYAMTIFGYKKAGMDEKEYHDYISETHAGHLKALLAKNDIVSYTMVSIPIGTIDQYVPAFHAPVYVTGNWKLISCRMKATQHHRHQQAAIRTDNGQSSPDRENFGLRCNHSDRV